MTRAQPMRYILKITIITLGLLSNQAVLSADKFDWVISGGTVFDGSGEPGYPADIGIIDDKIAWLGRFGKRSHLIVGQW